VKKILSVITLCLFAASSVCLPEKAYAAALPITATSALLLDQNANLIYAKNVNERRAPASTTKILTAIVAMDMLSMDDIITIPSFAEAIQPSKIYLKRGERYYVRDLLRATLMNSANDAATVLAVAAAGSEPAFAAKMNAKARAIGCKRSKFVHASGLPAKNQYSTAYDMALIMRHSRQYPFVVETLKTRTGTISSLEGRKIALRNHNKMLWKDSREVVGKTGWTRNAKHCFVGKIGAGSSGAFVSMLGSRSLWKDLKVLVDYVFSKFFGVNKRSTKTYARETEKIQLALKRAGFDPGSIDGIMGKSTRRAVRQFQKNQGLKADGIVGPATTAKLQKFQL